MLCNFSKVVLKDRSHHPKQTLLSNSITARPQKFTIQRAKETFPAQIFSPPHTKTSTDIPAPLPAQLRHPSMAAGQRLSGRMSAALPPVVPMCLLTDRAGAAQGTRRTCHPRRPGHPGRARTARLAAPAALQPTGTRRDDISAHGRPRSRAGPGEIGENLNRGWSAGTAAAQRILPPAPEHPRCIPPRWGGGSGTPSAGRNPRRSRRGQSPAPRGCRAVPFRAIPCRAMR